MMLMVLQCRLFYNNPADNNYPSKGNANIDGDSIDDDDKS